MAVPQTRNDFKNWCLRKIGMPVISLNLDDDQIEDRIDEALNFFWDYHFEGAEKVYYKYQYTAQDLTNQYITLPPNIIGTVNIFPVGTSLSTNNLFNIRYQITLNDLYDLTSTTMVPYYMAMQHIQFLEQLLVGQQPIRFSRYTNQLHIDMSWDNVNVGDFLIVEAYQVVDPTVYAGVWSDRWLQRYATTLIKLQWAENIGKYQDIKLPAGNVLNGAKIYADADREKDKLEEEMINTWSLPVADLIG